MVDGKTKDLYYEEFDFMFSEKNKISKIKMKGKNQL